MKPKEFFILVMHLREAQKSYCRTSSQTSKRECRYLETMIDREIERVKSILPNDTEINPPPLIEPTHPSLNLE